TEPAEASAPEAPAVIDVVERASVTLKRAEIDWEAARADYAAREIIPGENTFSVASETTLSVPVLLPSMPVSTASVGGEDGMQFRPLADGYYAVYPGEVYDMIINGTDRLAVAPGRGLTPTDTALRFEETMTGAQVSFSRYGASYLVEFACKSPDDAKGDGCVSEAGARAAVQDLLLAGTQ
ncbi:MAG: hypothetical protein L3J02_04505, partial [Henriciella sp.]|nr:hypothetical protein [Henriciella sp.]